MKLLIAGLGSIGRRHVRTLKALEPGARIAVWRHDRSSVLPEEMKPLVEAVVFSAEEALAWRPEAAVIANPAPMHAVAALPFIENRIPVLIEKPLAATREDAERLHRAAAQHRAPVLVGYTLRFHPHLRKMRDAIRSGAIGRLLNLQAHVGQYLPDWRKEQDYRHGVTARKDLGGGVLLELSHEIDYARWLMGEVEAVTAVTGRLGDLEIDVEDTAEITMRFASGAVGHIHLDMLDRVKTRWCRAVGTDASSHVDLMSMPGDDPYVLQMRHFLACVSGAAHPVVEVEDGRAVLEIIDAVRRSASTGRTVVLQETHGRRLSLAGGIA